MVVAELRDSLALCIREDKLGAVVVDLGDGLESVVANNGTNFAEELSRDLVAAINWLT